MTRQKVTCNHRTFPNDKAVLKVVYLAILNIAKKWTMLIEIGNLHSIGWQLNLKEDFPLNLD